VLSSATVRRSRVGDLLPPSFRVGGPVRTLEAVAIVAPGAGPTSAYREQLSAAEPRFAAWDGRVIWLDPDGVSAHRLVVADRYGQVYAVHDAGAADEMPGPHELEEWFRFLATACPECGVLDDPIGRGWVP
jgi:hypothetical protein